MVIPMLTDSEWEIVAPVISAGRIKIMRETQGISLDEASKIICKEYNEITGSNETNVNAIWHHVASQYGPDCIRCGKPYRTPKARYCVECGFDIEKISSG